MSNAVLAIDAGTTNVMSMVVGGDGAVLSRSAKGLHRNYPAPGLVEQDPEELWSVVLHTMGQALERAGMKAADLDAIGITGQRSTVIIWERSTGRPLHPLVGWQDQRGAARSAELLGQGFITVASTTPASKMELILGAIPRGFEMMRAPERGRHPRHGLFEHMRHRLLRLF